MSAGFGFSVGDFLTALDLVSTVIDALRDSGQAGNEHRELLRQLYSLETALIQVKRLEVDDSQHAELMALTQAAAQCQYTINRFWDKIEVYQRNLGPFASSVSRLRDRWMRVRWAVCKKDDVARFKADLAGHTESIQLLLSTLQMATLNVHSRKHEYQQQSLAGRIQSSYFQCMRKLSSMSDNIISGLQQSKQLLEMTTQVLRTNVRVFQAVIELHNILKRVPGQIERQQPVFLIDGLGRASPFHLEFIRSAEAFVAVLAVNFKKFEDDKKILNREFVIEDSTSKQDIDLEADWDLCFSPGQSVEMSMVYQQPKVSSTCPYCRTDCSSHEDRETEW